MIAEPQSPNTLDLYKYNGRTLRELRACISPERFGTYLELAEGDRRRAIQMYLRNTALGGALHGPLQALEVTLRNAVHRTLAASCGEFWFDSSLLLRATEQVSVRRANQKLRKQRTPGRVVAELNFGFWVALFSKTYDNGLWRTDLHLRFTPQPKRRELHDQLNRLRTLRNRIAHHEPILQRDVRVDHERILWILEMLSPATAAWVRHHSRVLEVLDTKPHLVTRF